LDGIRSKAVLQINLLPNAKLSYPDQALAVRTGVWWSMKTSGKK